MSWAERVREHGLCCECDECVGPGAQDGETASFPVPNPTDLKILLRFLKLSSFTTHEVALWRDSKLCNARDRCAELVRNGYLDKIGKLDDGTTVKYRVSKKAKRLLSIGAFS